MIKRLFLALSFFLLVGHATAEPVQEARLGVTNLTGFNVSGGPVTLLSAIRGAGVSDSNIKAVLDMASADTYGGSGQDVFDMTANNVDFWRGADNTAASNDPTFNGTAGALDFTNYFSHDGGDQFRAQSQPSFIHAFHKENANFTIIFIAGTPSSFTSSNGLSGTENNGVGPGFSLTVQSSDVLQFNVNDGSANNITQATSATVPTSSDVFLALSLDEAGGSNASILDINGTQETFDGAYTNTPSSSNASQTLEVGAIGAGTQVVQNGFKTYGVAFLDIALTGSQLDSIRAAYMGR